MVVAGCSSGGGGGPDSPAAFDSQLNDAYCVYNARCGYYGASEVKQCESDAAAAAKMYPPAYSTTSGVQSNKLSYDAARAQACLDAVSKAGCSNDSYYALGDVCNGVFKGLVQAGGACVAALECAPGNWCDQGTNTGTAGCTGTCKANIATGQTCDPNNSHCNDSDYCDDSAGTGMGTCTATLKQGDSCVPGQCGIGLNCNGYDSGPPEVKGVCATLAKVGGKCTTSFLGTTNCQLGLWCNDADMNNAVCATPVASGGECQSYFACADGLDCLGLAFDANGAVTTKGKCGPFLDIGKSCSSVGGEAGCPYDSTCDATSMTCKLGGMVGDTCDPTSTGGCSGNNYCDGNTSKCAQLVALGGACTPAPTDANGFPLGDEPCHDGSCDATTNKCAVTCQ
jgi:hypothetical protein